MKRFILALLLMLSVAAFGQDAASGIQEVSTNNFGVDLATSNVHISIPIRSKGSFNASLQLDSHIYLSASAINTSMHAVVSPLISGTAYAQGLSVGPGTCGGNNGEKIAWYGVTDTTGALHPWSISVGYFGVIYTYNTGYSCNLPSPTQTLDGMYTVTWTGNLTTTIVDKAGNTVSGTSITDADNNSVLSEGTWASGITYADVLGVEALRSNTSGQPGQTVLQYKDANANYKSYTITNTEYTLKTNFACTNGISDMPPTPIYLPTSISTPTGATYTFTYESQFSGSGTYGPYTTGRIKQITYPSGGFIKYAYSQNGDSNGQNGFDCTSQVVPKITVEVNDNNVNDGTWIFTNSNRNAEGGLFGNSGPSQGNYSVTAIDPAGNYITYHFAGEYQTKATYYQGSSTVLNTVVTCYGMGGNAPPSLTNCPQPSTQPVIPFTEVDVYTMPNNFGSYNRVQKKFDSYGNVTYTGVYDFGGSPLLSQSVISYGSWNGTNCTPVGSNIFNRACDGKTEDGSSNVLSESRITYNSTGHPTSSAAWVSGANGWLTSTASYNGNGTTAWSKDVAGNQTTFAYNGTGGCNNLLLTSTTYAMSSVGSDATQWDCNGGVPIYYTDVNGRTTSYCYTNTGYNSPCNPGPGPDPLYRLTYTVRPDGGYSSYSYSTGSYLPWSTSTSTRQWTGSVVSTTTMDGLGRVVNNSTTDPNSSSGYTYGQTTFNNLGQVTAVYSPYFSSPGAYTSYLYDAIGRTTQVTDPDFNHMVYVYNNRATAITDEIDRQKEYQVDGMGRIIYVCEGIGDVTQANNVAPANCNLDYAVSNGFLTTYGYDARNNLTNVSITGTQSRTFTYDGLSRMTEESNPETGNTFYTYDTGTPGQLYQRTWNNGVVTTMSYDHMNRPVTIAYSDSTTPWAVFGYDGAGFGAGYNVKGRLSLAETCSSGITTCNESNGPWPVTAETFSYDNVGRVTNDQQCTSSFCVQNFGWTHFQLTYGYDYLGNSMGSTLSALCNGCGSIISYTNTLNSIGQTTSIASSYLGSTQGSGNLVTSISYNAFGQPTTDTLANGDVEGFTYDTVGRPTAHSSSNNWYSYGSNSWLGSYLASSFDSVNGTWGYVYDGFGRLSTADCTVHCTDSPVAVNYAYTYDQYGNRWTQTYSGTGSTGVTSLLTFNSNNQETGNTYDANGNVTSDGTYSYTYDADNRVVSDGFSGNTYTYDAFGRRAHFVNGANYYDNVYDALSGQLVFQITNGAYATGQDWAVIGGRNFGFVNMGSSLGFVSQESDWQGSGRSWRTLTGSSYQKCHNLPFGDRQDCSASNFAQSDWAGQQYDGLAMFREYNPVQGHWGSPDPAGHVAVNGALPQSWNRYAYAGNNPVSLSDPSGLDSCQGNTCSLTYNAGDNENIGDGFDDPGNTDIWGGDDDLVGPDPLDIWNSAFDYMVTGLGSLWSDFSSAMDGLNTLGNSWSTDPSVGQGTHGPGILDQLGLLTGGALETGLSGWGGSSGTMAFGITRSYPEGKALLQPFAKEMGGLNTYATFSGYSGFAKLTWPERDIVLIEQADTIHFNLEGMGSDKAITRLLDMNVTTSVDGTWGLRSGGGALKDFDFARGYTIGELRYIRNNWDTLGPKTFFYRGANHAVSPPWLGR